MKFKSLIILIGFISVLIAEGATTKRYGFEWEKAIVNIEASSIQYDFRQPWARQAKQTIKSGVVVRNNEILTTADGLENCTMTRAQKIGESKWWDAKIKWIDYHANLALIKVEDSAFWNKMKPAPLSTTSPDKDDIHIVRWTGANLEFKRVEFSEYVVEEGELSPLNCVQMELESGGDKGAKSAILISKGKIVGLVVSQKENTLRALPSIFIKNILAEEQKGNWRGLGYFPFYWQPSPNPAIHQYLNWKGEPRGVVVIEVDKSASDGENLKPLDLILEIDGFAIDAEGYYNDPDFGRLILENLATRNKFAGDIILIKVWREGKEQIIKYKLPGYTFNEKLVIQQVFDEEPEYIIVGGLIFQPLTKPYLKSFGAEWRRIAPFRLVYLDEKPATPERPSAVILAGVLPDVYNLGYQDYRGLVVQKINNLPIFTISDVQKALEKPVDGFHIIEFERGDSLRRMVLDATAKDEATQRVLKRYGIPKHFNINTKKLE